MCLIPCSAQRVGLPATQQPLPGQQLQVRLPDLSSYGDGLVWGAALLLHSLGQTAHFKLTDLTTLLLESHQFGWRSTSLHLTSTPTADSCLSWSMSSHNCMFAAHCCLSSSNVNPHLSVMKMLLTSSGYVQLQCRSCFKTQNLLLLSMWSLTTCNKDCASCRVKHRQARLCSFCHKGACPKMHPQPGANNAVCHSASVASINCPEEKQSEWSRAMLCSRFLLSTTPVQIAQPVQHVVREIQTTTRCYVRLCQLQYGCTNRLLQPRATKHQRLCWY